VLLGATACGSAPKGQVKGTFPYCTYQPMEDGVFVPEENPRQCVVDDTREADDRAGYKGGHTVIVPRGTTSATRTPLPVPSTAKPTTQKATPPAAKPTKAAATKSVKKA
jgi:hypothetical protein